MQTNAPSAYGRHTVAKSIFSFTKIRSALIKKIPVFHYWQHWITLQCLWNRQYHFKNRAAVPGRHVSQHTYMHDCTHAPDATQSVSVWDCSASGMQHAQQQLRGIPSSLLFLCPVMVIREGETQENKKKKKKGTHNFCQINFFLGWWRVKKKLNKHDSFPIIHCEIHSITAIPARWSKESAPTQRKVSLTSAAKLYLKLASRLFSSSCHGRVQTQVHGAALHLCSGSGWGAEKLKTAILREHVVLTLGSKLALKSLAPNRKKSIPTSKLA